MVLNNGVIYKLHWMLLNTRVRYCTECCSILGSNIALKAPQYWGSDTALNAAYIPNANQKFHSLCIKNMATLWSMKEIKQVGRTERLENWTKEKGGVRRRDVGEREVVEIERVVLLNSNTRTRLEPINQIYRQHWSGDSDGLRWGEGGQVRKYFLRCRRGGNGAGFKGKVPRDFLYSVFPPNSFSWSH